MKYGMNLLLWSGEVTDDVLQVCGKLKEIGYDGVELPIFNLDLDYSAIGSELDSLGLGRTGVTVRGEEDNPISPDPAVRAGAPQADHEFPSQEVQGWHLRRRVLCPWRGCFCAMCGRTQLHV